MSTTGHGISGDGSDNVGGWRCRSLRKGSKKDDLPFRCCLGANESGVRICGTCFDTREDGLWVKLDAAEQDFPVATPEEASLHWSLRRGQWQCRLRDSTNTHYICDTINEGSAKHCKVSPKGSPGCGRKKTEGLFLAPPGSNAYIPTEISRYYAIVREDSAFDQIIIS